MMVGAGGRRGRIHRMFEEEGGGRYEGGREEEGVRG